MINLPYKLAFPLKKGEQFFSDFPLNDIKSSEMLEDKSTYIEYNSGLVVNVLSEETGTTVKCNKEIVLTQLLGKPYVKLV